MGLTKSLPHFLLSILIFSNLGCFFRSTITRFNSAQSTTCLIDQINDQPCDIADAGFVVTNKFGSDVTSYNNSSATSTLTASLPTGWYDGKSCQVEDTYLISENIKSGSSIFGVSGSSLGSFSLNTNSFAYRNPGSVPVANHLDNQSTSYAMSLYSEVNTYAGAALPTSGGYTYRSIPAQAKDDEGYLGTSCAYAPRPNVTCGTTQTTIIDRIADCLNLNGTCSDVSYTTKSTCEAAAKNWTSTAIWDGATKCNAGQGLWKLVTRSAANKEVWQDSRTGLLWSSKVTTSNNWCQASGNTQLAPLVFHQSYNGAAGSPITGNGKISLVTSGTSMSDEAIVISFVDAANFTVTGDYYTNNAFTPSCDDNLSPSRTGAITSTIGSSTTYSVANTCGFKITQGSINFVAGDTFVLRSSDSSYGDCTPNAGSGLQPLPPLSLCAEAIGLNPSGETWTSPGYMTAKGGLGKNSAPSVAWRLPTINDYRLAEVNGIRMVMPDMGIAGLQRPSRDGSAGGSSYEWSASVYSFTRSFSWIFGSGFGYVSNNFRNVTYAARCVGR